MTGRAAQAMRFTSDIRSANYDFSVDLFKELSTAHPTANVFLSPASISLVLAMCYLGADGKTKSDMKRRLYGSGQDEQVKTWSRKILKMASDSNNQYQLRFADRIYLNDRFQMKQDYVNSIQEGFNASVLRGNFRTDAAKITREINAWVEKITENKIKDLVAQGELNDGTIMLLINALYFKGAWQDEFEVHETKKQDFHISINQKVQVDMMHLKKHKGYYENPDVKVLELDYRQSRISMIIILPKEKNGLQNVIQGLDGGKLSHFVGAISRQEVIIELPKFKIENSFKLNDVLKKLGLGDAFSSAANFSRMTDAAIKISDVIHKSYIKVKPMATDISLAYYNFSFDLLKQLSRENQTTNIFLSPASISLVLAMCYFGADGKTKSDMKQILFGNGQDEQIKTWSQKILTLASDSSSQYQLRFADRIYLNDRFQLKKDYVNSVQQVFNASVLKGNFGTDAAKITREINAWVEKITESKIKDLVAQGELNDGTSMLLINALYFKGAWQDEFEEHGTKKQDFHVSSNKTVQMDMMHLTKHKGYYENRDVQVLELDYRQSRISMIIILPKQKNGLQNVLQGLNGEKLSQVIGGMRQQEVIIELPKFKIENSFKLNDALKKMGLGGAFSSEANFSRMTDAAVKISDAIHKSYIKIDEKGTEAAAATKIGLSGSGWQAEPPQPKTFTADHPFLFLIVAGYQNEQEILFIGKFNGESD